MASVAEQLASNISFSAFKNATELKQRIWFTLLALLVYRFGTYLPLPGINIDTLRQIFEQNQSGIIGIFNMFAGGAVGSCDAGDAGDASDASSASGGGRCQKILKREREREGESERGNT